MGKGVERGLLNDMHVWANPLRRPSILNFLLVHYLF